MVDLIKRGRCDLVINTPEGRDARRTVRDPRGGADAARAVHHDALRRGGCRPRDRDRARRAAVSLQDRIEPKRSRRLRVTAPNGSARTRSSASSAAGSSPARPGQFFMLEAPGRLLPRPFSLCTAPPGELGFLVDPIGPGTGRSPRSSPATRSESSARSATATASTSSGRSSSAGGSASRRCRISRAARRQRTRRARLPQRRPCRGRLAPAGRRGRVDPVLVTELIELGLRRAGVRPRADAATRSHALCPTAQLAWEAPMACGYGACYGCVVEIDGALKRLCLEGRCSTRRQKSSAVRAMEAIA